MRETTREDFRLREVVVISSSRSSFGKVDDHASFSGQCCFPPIHGLLSPSCLALKGQDRHLYWSAPTAEFDAIRLHPMRGPYRFAVGWQAGRPAATFRSLQHPPLPGV